MIEAARLVTCGDCGDRFELSARNVRAAHAAGRQPKCRRCRYGSKPPRSTAALRAWWTRRYTEAELVELALGVWPNLQRTASSVNVERSSSAR